MTTSDRGIDLIKRFEGCRLDAYRCVANRLTIGYGHTGDVASGQAITAEQAEELLRADLATRERSVARMVTSPLEQHQFDALVSLVYNIGEGNLSRSTLIRKLNAGDAAGASAQFLVWDKVAGESVPGLARRRRAEREMFDGLG